VQGITLVGAALFVLISVAVAILYAGLDPRLRIR
jgi:ABC-type dipeptide/oligopeptide/nickel transport system permease component